MTFDPRERFLMSQFPPCSRGGTVRGLLLFYIISCFRVGSAHRGGTRSGFVANNSDSRSFHVSRRFLEGRQPISPGCMMPRNPKDAREKVCDAGSHVESGPRSLPSVQRQRSSRRKSVTRRLQTQCPSIQGRLAASSVDISNVRFRHWLFGLIGRSSPRIPLETQRQA